MLLILLYHRIDAAKYPKRLDMFSAHLRYLSKRYPIVLPGDPLPPGKMSVCLTFDDAYFDFYQHVFPLLTEFRVKTLLSVPTKYILNGTTLDSNARLSVPSDRAMTGAVFEEKAPFCTWDELSEMVATGLVEVASHSHSHRALTEPGADLTEELVASKRRLEDRLHKKITTFVYPFGKVNRRVHSAVAANYPFAMRIGTALNKDWHNSKGLLYRVDADGLPNPAQPFSKTNLSRYMFNYLVNTVRGK
ncbi:MAG TPA: polysaccharide deacetylase family protein [Thermodesulfovibrionales bacterium]|nr:polysaccharide deacetylase family protein [Thermodesulfovibrionales bacterium]